MTQPGWYADPAGGGGQRWWDGAAWAQDVQPSPPPPAQAAGPVLNTTVDGRHVFADTQTIFYDGRSIALEHVEWVRYFVGGTNIRGPFGIGHSAVSREWHFEVGRYPVKRAEIVPMAFGTVGGREHPAWSFLVDLSRRYLEPRLVAELAGRVRGGETVEVGGAVKVTQGGISGGGVSLSWHEITGTSTKDGRLWIHKAGKRRPVLWVPLQNPNTVVMPALFTALGH
jgi:hypothetical protein